MHETCQSRLNAPPLDDVLEECKRGRALRYERCVRYRTDFQCTQNDGSRYERSCIVELSSDGCQSMRQRSSLRVRSRNMTRFFFCLSDGLLTHVCISLLAFSGVCLCACANVSLWCNVCMHATVYVPLPLYGGFRV